MEKREQFIEDEQALDQVLGYLNFSSGNADPKFLGNLNRLWQDCLASQADGTRLAVYRRQSYVSGWRRSLADQARFRTRVKRRRS